jgi:FAD/FMN-containing dehydrogenase
MTYLQSWGRFPSSEHKTLFFDNKAKPLPLPPAEYTLLPYGKGRSYGDCCLNNHAYLLPTTNLDHILQFDSSTGRLICEAGVTLEEILKFAIPKKWFLPATPGTKFITLGGAIANDIHGKNHHRTGTFVHAVREFELLRSNGERLRCSPMNNSDWFNATVGGLGLTGLITWAEIQLKPIYNPFIEQEIIRFKNIEEFFNLSLESEEKFEYTVAWFDGMATGSHLGRGLYMRGYHASEKENNRPAPDFHQWSIPVDAPNWFLNSYGIRLFNTLYYWKQFSKQKSMVTHYDPFFYPLDSIKSWNRIYGPRGFLQYQFVIPYKEDKGATLKKMLKHISDSGIGSFLNVLKIFGDKASPGLLSFPKPGVTLALDFPNVGAPLFSLLSRLDQWVEDMGGSVYLAKDSRMSPSSFRKFYPRWEEFQKYIDPRFSSSLWRRVTQNL